MPMRKLNVAVSVARGVVTTKNSRGGETHRPKERRDLKAGDVFDFTQKEIDDIVATYGEEALSTEASVDLTTGEIEGGAGNANTGGGEL